MNKTVKVVVMWISIYYGERKDLIEIPEKWLNDGNLFTLVAMKLSGVKQIISVKKVKE